MSKVSLRHYVEALFREKDLRDEQRFDAQAIATQAALAAVKEAGAKAENASEKRFDAVNEFRRTLTDQAATFVSRVEFNALKERMDRNDGKASGISALWGIIVAIGGLVAAGVATAAYFLK